MKEICGEKKVEIKIASMDAQTKATKRKSDAERKTKYIEGLNVQQHAMCQQHHVQAQAKLQGTMPPGKKEKMKVQLTYKCKSKAGGRCAYRLGRS